jgi:guanylate kinase
VEKKAKVVIFSAPSGAGKTTLVHRLMEQVPDLAFSVSATSRAPRKGEKNGVDYYFLSVEEFKKKIEEGAFIEWEEVYPGQYYGTLKSEVERLRNEGKTVVFDVDVLGGINIKRIFGDDALAVFVKPPSLEVLKERLTKRSTEDEESLKKRLSRAEKELEYESKFDIVIVNDDLKKAVKEVVETVTGFIEQNN